MSIANTQSETIFQAGIVEPNDQTEARVEHLKQLETLVGNSYPNKFERTRISGAEDTISNVLNFAPVAEIAKELKDNTPTGEKPNQELKETLNQKLKAFGSVRISGRLAVPPRVMGKAAFVHLSDGVNRLQIYVRKQDALAVSNDTLQTIDEEGKAWEVFGLLDHGDFIGASGFLFLTNTGELSVHVETIQFLSKSLMPMPDKMHDIADAEISRRYRYVDLIASSLRNKTDDELEEERRTGVVKLTTREVFERRAKLISGMRRFLDDAGYIEVETPMLTPKATGAAATPFVTHHNALDITLYARIAPELYLKRLTVGGFEKVYELNRNFRNEGLSQKHNPEFTMLEFYCAYMDVNGMMDFCEAMLKESVRKATGGSLQVKIDEVEEPIDFSKFEKVSMKDSIKNLLQNSFPTNSSFSDDKFDNPESLYKIMEAINAAMTMPAVNTQAASYQHDENANAFVKTGVTKSRNIDKIRTIFSLTGNDLFNAEVSNVEFQGNKIEEAKIIQYLFELIVEETLTQPTFIIDYPKSISPLSKASPANPNVAERFELFINGMECANGFSELNDPQEQYERFADQMRSRETGDEEAMVMDEDYIRALAFGMPPAAGIGIGIDRLVMLLTNRHSIRDVILFPHMRPEKREEEKEREEKEMENAL